MKRVITATLIACAGFAQAAYNDHVKLLGSNSGNSGESTFVTNILRSSYGWSDKQDPHSGDKYYCGYQLCTPNVASGSYEFAGDRLVMAAGLRVLNDMQQITVDDLVFINGGFVQTAGAQYATTFFGTMTIESTSGNPAYFECGTAYASYTVSSALKGDATAYCRVQLKSGSKPVGQYVRLNDASGYAGTFEVRDARLKLYSDLAGTVVVDSGSTLEVGTDATVGSLTLEAGSALDLSVGGSLALTNGFTMAEGVTLVLPAFTTVGPHALITLPIGKGTLDADAFTVSSTTLCRLWTETKDGLQTIYCERLRFNTYDATTGYVTRTGSSGNCFDRPGDWSDGRCPHADTNCYSSATLDFTTNSVFGGRSLTLGWSVSMRFYNLHLTIPDLRVESGSGNTSSFFSTQGYGSKSSWLHGGMTVLSRVTDLWPFAFFGSNSDGQTWVSYQTIHGDAESALVARGHFGSTPGAVRNYVELRGDLNDFKGTLIVQHNETVRLGNVTFPGTVRLETAYSHLATVGDVVAVAKVGTLDVRTATSVEVPLTNEIAVSSVTLAGALTKAGTGVFAAASVGGTTPTVMVQEGFFKALAKDAVKDAALTFADGTGIAVEYEPADSEMATSGADLRSTALAVNGSISILVQAAAKPTGESATFVPICTVTTAQADELEGKIGAVCVAFGGTARQGRLVRRSAGEGVSILGANVAGKGLAIVFR